MLLDLSNKRALVCGASQGIGEATARLLAEMGAEVILAARNQSKLESIKEQLPTTKNQVHRVLSLDLHQLDNLPKHLETALERGPISILVNNAGGPKSGPLLNANQTDFLDAFQTHLISASIIAQTLVPGMKELRYGRIINIISTSVKVPISNLGVSNTIRGAMASWAKTLATEVAPYHITVNNVLPGYTATPRLDDLAEAAAKKQNKSIDEIKNSWKAATPAGRFAEPAEVATAIGFLASPQSAFITGINLPVDGGRTPCL